MLVANEARSKKNATIVQRKLTALAVERDSYTARNSVRDKTFDDFFTLITVTSILFRIPYSSELSFLNLHCNPQLYCFVNIQEKK